jgi:hypothetical protein
MGSYSARAEKGDKRLPSPHIKSKGNSALEIPAGIIDLVKDLTAQKLKVTPHLCIENFAASLLRNLLYAADLERDLGSFEED